MGKSRISAGVAIGLLDKYKAKYKEIKVIVVWPHEILMRQDAKPWDEVEMHFERTGAVLIRVVGIEAAYRETNKDTIILVDEADQLFVKEKRKPPRDCKVCCGFTATIPEGESQSFIGRRLVTLGFKI